MDKRLSSLSVTQITMQLRASPAGGCWPPGAYPTGPGSEFNKIKKWGDRAFE